MSKFYYTFGSSPQFPYQNGYIIIEAESFEQADNLFKALFPNPINPHLLNCAFRYSELHWQKAIANHQMHFYGTYRMTFTETEQVKCCLCGERIEKKYGHNAQPIMKGICCIKCNMTHVIPARITIQREKIKNELCN